MGAAVARYEINGKFDKKAVSDAQIALTRLKKTASAVSASMAAFAVGKVFQLASSAVNGATDAFRNQELQVKRLDTAVKNNANLTKGAFDRLQQEAGKLSNAAIFSGEDITKNQAFLASMKLNEKQINSVMKAATNMASAGVMPLDQAVKTLSKTFDGNVGKLKELNPELANMTEEQLKNGEAIAAIAKQYEGFNEAVANSEHGKALQFANTFDDLKKTIGEIIQSVKNIGFSHLLGPLQRITSKLAEHKDQIVNFFRYLPEIAVLSFNSIKNMATKAMNWDFLWKSFKGAIKLIFKWWMLWLKTSIAAVKAVGGVIWHPLKYGFDLVIYGIKTGFYGMINVFIDGINVILEKVNNVRKVFGQQGIGLFQKWDSGSIAKPENNVGKNIVDGFKNLAKTFKSSLEDVKEAATDLGQTLSAQFGDDIAKLGKNITAILNRNKPKDPTTTATGMGTGDGGKTDGKEGEKAAQQEQPEYDAIGALCETAKEAGGAIGWLTDVTVRFIKGGCDPLILVVELLKIILAGFLAILAPVIDSLFIPLFGYLRVLGKMLGLILIPYLRMFEPIIKAWLNWFLFLYNNVFIHIGNGLIWLFNKFHNIVVAVINGISSLVKKITFGRLDLGQSQYRSGNEGYLQKISHKELVQEGRQALKLAPQTSTIGSGAGVSGASGARNAVAGAGAAVAGKPAEVHIHFDHSYVNGDAREIALMLKKEMAEATKMGY